MKFPNLVWALAEFGPRYRFAASIGKSESWLSRRLIGRIPFSPEDRLRVAAALNFEAEWLFTQPPPPLRPERERREQVPAIA